MSEGFDMRADEKADFRLLARALDDMGMSRQAPSNYQARAEASGSREESR